MVLIFDVIATYKGGYSRTSSVRFSTTAKKVLPRNTDFICGNQKKNRKSTQMHFVVGLVGLPYLTKVSIRCPHRVWTHLFSTANIGFRYNPAGPPGNLGRTTPWNARLALQFGCAADCSKAVSRLDSCFKATVKYHSVVILLESASFVIVKICEGQRLGMTSEWNCAMTTVATGV